jgi:glycerol-3-phosphate O-acyltransferase
MNIKVPKKYPLSHNDRIVVLEIHLHSESPMIYRSALHGNWNALSLARRALKDKFPTPTIPLTAVLPNRQVFLPDPVEYLQSLRQSQDSTAAVHLEVNESGRELRSSALLRKKSW